MTARQMSQFQHTEIADRTAARSRDLGFFKAPASDVRVQRMNNIERIGNWDRTDDERLRLRSGMVGGERMTATVVAHGGELVVTFSCGDRRRRFLVDAVGTYFADFDGREVVLAATNKYFAPLNAIWAARAN